MGWLWGVLVSSLIVGILLFIIVNFYIFSSVINVDSFFYLFIVLSVLTDGLFVFIHLPRRKHRHSELQFDPSKLTIVIICYNGADVIAETIRQAATHVPLDQILVVSDASTDATVQIAHAAGARVFENRRNVNKAFSISAIMKRVITPYTLVLDDDTLIEKTFIPTSLLDDGYTAVAFNVMPEKDDSIVNALQMFEYRKSMEVGKNLKANVGAINNVSGAIGLFRTVDLQDQSRKHSGQFGGEDEQRTALAHLHGTGKGITYTDSLVITKPPATWYKLLKQRAFSWNLSVPELFFVNWRILLHPKLHYLLKAEKAYQLYIYLTDPLRILFFYLLFTRPTRVFASYGFYLLITFLLWLKTGCKDKLWVVFVFPIYSLLMSTCRFVAHFYWHVVKFRYIFLNKFHRLVPERKLLAEYAFVFGITLLLWGAAIQHVNADLQLLAKLQNNRIDTFNTESLDYADSDGATQALIPSPIPAPTSSTDVIISVAPSDTPESLADKAITTYDLDKATLLDEARRSLAVAALAKTIVRPDGASQTMSLPVAIASIERAISEAKQS